MSRTATPETRRALRAAVAEYASRRQWAIAHDIAPVDVSDCLNGRPVSARRENRLRAALPLAAAGLRPGTVRPTRGSDATDPAEDGAGGYE